MQTVMQDEAHLHMQHNTPHRHQRRSMLATCPILSALVVLAVVSPPLVTKPYIETAGSARSSGALTFLDRARKGDGIVTTAATFAARWNVLYGGSGGGYPPPARLKESQTGKKVPFGCDPAFGVHVRINFSGRCIASVDTRVRLAAAG
jgi:hypothetical protein